MGSKMWRAVSVVLLLTLVVPPVDVFATEESIPVPDINPVLITALQVSSANEFVEINNTALEPIDVDGWKLTYTNATGGNLKTLAVLSGSLAPGAYKLFVSADFLATILLNEPETQYEPLLYSGMADSGGFVRLYQKVQISADYPEGYKLVQTLGWKSSSSVSEDLDIVNLSGLKSLKRCTDLLGKYSTRNDNQIDFYVEEVPLLYALGAVCSDLVSIGPVVPDTDPVPVTDTPTDIVDPITGPVLSCEGLLLNEVLPNAKGDDNGREFIEIFNPTNETIDLKGCSLELVANTSDSYVFIVSETIEPGAFGEFADIKTGITLPNSSGAMLRLVSASNVELSTASYPSDLDDDQSWALFDSIFQSTYVPTPGGQNILAVYKPCGTGYERDLETNHCRLIPLLEVESATLCQDGQVLNPLTNRCKKIEIADTPTPCKEGQERNPETNRCRNINTGILSSTLTPCLEGQFRNPQTNRCKAIAASAEPTPCKEGQERNPETNRCKTIALANSAYTNILDVETVSTSSDGWFMTLALSIGAISYAIYEWRQEILSKISKIFRKKSTV